MPEIQEDNPMDRTCIYLRKSREDVEAEKRGEGETLEKHKKALLKAAKQQNLNIIKIRQEIVSGESLIHRPEMMELLREVEAKMYDAVLVMDMDRLGRGNMKEQGLILETFKEADTKIITPRKTYDLHDEWDEEYSEFEAFMARKELKIITRRLQGGRIRSVEEGNYIGTRPPYGYEIKEESRNRFLVPHPEQAPVVKMIFEWYTSDDPRERMGTKKIANKLNELGYLSYTGIPWKGSSVLIIIKNAVYTGKVQWKKKSYKKSKDPEKRREAKLRPQTEWIEAQGKHEPLISDEIYRKAQDILKNKSHVPYRVNNKITNPLAGLIRCAKCNSSMVLRPSNKQKPHLICQDTICNNKSTRFEYVEQALMLHLKEWLSQYKLQWEQGSIDEPSQNKIQVYQTSLKNLEQEWKNLNDQKGRLHDLLERGIYDDDTYIERSNYIADKLTETKEKINQIENDLSLENDRMVAKVKIIPQIENVMDLYKNTTDPKVKNNLLKSVLIKCMYNKEKWQVGNDFTLDIYPKL
jgi:site-specific DNA recombinase